MANTQSIVNYGNRLVRAGGATSATKYAHRHPNSVRALRWTMGRVEGNILLSWWVNPSECQWRMATRTTIEKISGGCVHHEWPQTGIQGSNPSFQGSRFDQPVLSMTFQAGIITPGGYNDILSGQENDTTAPWGLGNFFDFMRLLEQPDMTTKGEANYIEIIYASPVFGGKGLWLQGFFTEEGVSWTDSADNPNTITSWGATFVVFNSQPPLKLLLRNFELLGIKV